MPKRKSDEATAAGKPPAAAKQGRRVKPASAAGVPAPPPSGDADEGAFGSAGRIAGQLIDTQKNLLKAGLRALKGDAKSGARGTWPLVTLEEVFDERVAAALDRLGMPTSAQLKELSDQVAKLTRRVDALSRKRGR